jgi:dimethylglycine dehydrogenase
VAGKHKAREDYCLRHEIPFPHFNRLPGRPIKPSPLYDRLKAKGDVERRDHFSCRRKVVHDMVGNECRAVRTGVGIMDISAVAKVEVTGPGTEAFLDRMVANRLPQKVGGIALTHMLNRRGRIELETTFVKLGAGRCYLVFAAFFEQRLLNHLEQHQVGEGAQVILRSNDWAALTLNGPKTRAVFGGVHGRGSFQRRISLA